MSVHVVVITTYLILLIICLLFVRSKKELCLAFIFPVLLEILLMLFTLICIAIYMLIFYGFELILMVTGL